MTLLNAFALSLGAILALAMVMSAWIARTASAPFAMKLVIPAVLVALACYTPWKVSAMLGYPSEASPPQRARLVAFVPHDGPSHNDTVDLWLVANGDTPRAFTVAMDEKLKQALRAAEAALRQGRTVMLVRQGGRAKKSAGQAGKGKTTDGTGTALAGDRNGIGHDDSGWDVRVESDMPPKAGE